MPFRTRLKTDWVKGKNKQVLEQNLLYYDNRSEELFVVPKGFVYDGASVPSALWPLFGHPFDEEVREAAALHDFLYRNCVVGRKVADQMFYDALVERGMGEYKAQLFYFGVRAGGRIAYSPKRS